MEEEKTPIIEQEIPKTVEKETKIEEEKEENVPKFFNNMKKIEATFVKKLSAFPGFLRIIFCCNCL